MRRTVLLGFFASLLALDAPAALAVTPTVYLTANDELGFSSFNAAGSWSSLSAPVAGLNYTNFNSNVPTQGSTLRTPPSTGNFTFAGDSLTIGGVPSAPAIDQVLRFKGVGG